VPTTKSKPFVMSKDEWDTKEGPGKSMNSVLYLCTVAWQKAPLGLNRHSTIKN